MNRKINNRIEGKLGKIVKYNKLVEKKKKLVRIVIIQNLFFQFEVSFYHYNHCDFQNRRGKGLNSYTHFYSKFMIQFMK